MARGGCSLSRASLVDCWNNRVSHCTGSITILKAITTYMLRGSCKNVPTATSLFETISPHDIRPGSSPTPPASTLFFLRLDSAALSFVDSNVARHASGRIPKQPHPTVRKASMGHAFAHLPASGAAGRLAKTVPMSACAIFLAQADRSLPAAQHSPQ